MKRLAFLLTLLAAGCGPLAGENPLAGIGSAVRDAVRPGDDQPAPQGLSLTRAMLAELPGDIIIVGIPARGAVAGLLEAGQNGTRTTWASPDGISITTEAGHIVATRGLGFDLMAADVSGLRAVLGGAASGEVVLETLGGEDQVLRQTLTCTRGETGSETLTIVERSFATTKVQVICQGPGVRFGNNYWVDRSGVVRRSQQYLNAETGYLNVDRP